MKWLSKKEKTGLESFRQSKDRFFTRDTHSPLTEEQKRCFTGLKYFPWNPEMRFELSIQTLPVREQISIQTTSGVVRYYNRAGKIEFEVENQAAELTVYQNGDGFFLPFIDSLAGLDTYPAGRYLDPHLLADGKILIDFNMAYNPYCAYNDLYSCPLSPPENRLVVPIRAGEKIPEGDWVHS